MDRLLSQRIVREGNQRDKDEAEATRTLTRSLETKVCFSGVSEGVAATNICLFDGIDLKSFSISLRVAVKAIMSIQPSSIKVDNWRTSVFKQRFARVEGKELHAVQTHRAFIHKPGEVGA